MKTRYVYGISLNYTQNAKCYAQSCRENQDTYLMFNNIPPPLENRDVSEKMSANNVQAEKATDDNMARAYCMMDK